jgi:hypothetical protein
LHVPSGVAAFEVDSFHAYQDSPASLKIYSLYLSLTYMDSY